MTSRAIDPATLDDAQGLQLVGPPEWPYAQVKDWMLLHLGLKHVEVRVYGIYRSLATRWRHGRRLTKDQVRWLAPGVGGKPMSRSAFDGVLRRLVEYGLLQIERDRTVVHRVRNASTGRFEAVEALMWRVNELPIEGEDYAGPRSVLEALDAYPGPGWTEADRRALHNGDLLGHRRQISGTDDSWTELQKRDVSAGQPTRTPRQKSGDRCQKSGDRCQKSGNAEPVTSTNGHHQTGVSDGLTNSSSPYPSPAVPAQRAGREEEGEEKARTPEERSPRSEPRSKNPTQAATSENTADPHREAASRLVDSLPPVGADQRQPNASLRQHLITGVAARLAAGWTTKQLHNELSADLGGAVSPGVYRHRLDNLPDTPAAPPPTAPARRIVDPCPQHPHREAADCRPCNTPPSYPVRSTSTLPDHVAAELAALQASLRKNATVST